MPQNIKQAHWERFTDKTVAHVSVTSLRGFYELMAIPGTLRTRNEETILLRPGVAVLELAPKSDAYPLMVELNQEGYGYALVHLGNAKE